MHYYYIPVTRVQGWDGRVVWLKLPLEEVEQKYHIDKPPDPSVYYIKGYPYDKFSPFTTDYFPELPIIKTKQSATPSSSMPKIPSESTRIFKCPLCDTKFRIEDGAQQTRCVKPLSQRSLSYNEKRALGRMEDFIRISAAILLNLDCGLPFSLQ